MPVQSDYNQYGPRGLNGARASMRGAGGDTGIAGAAIPFGKAVSRVSDSERKVTKGGLAFRGVAQSDTSLSATTHPTADQYETGDNVIVVNDGDLWITVTETVAPGDPVGYHATTGQLGVTGMEIEEAVWLTGAESGDVALVRLAKASGNTAAPNTL